MLLYSSDDRDAGAGSFSTGGIHHKITGVGTVHCKAHVPVLVALQSFECLSRYDNAECLTWDEIFIKNLRKRASVHQF